MTHEPIKGPERLAWIWFRFAMSIMLLSLARRVLPQTQPVLPLPLPVPSALVHALAISLRILPPFAKVLTYLLVLLNLRSLPFAWHGMHPYLILASYSYLFMPPNKSQPLLAHRKSEMVCMVCPRAHLVPLLRHP